MALSDAAASPPRDQISALLQSPFSLRHAQVRPTHAHINPSCIYCATVILFYRPIYASDSEAAESCDAAALTILHLVRLHRATFLDGHAVFSMAYCVYVATSIFILDLRRSAEGSSVRVERAENLRYCVQCLEACLPACPGVQKPLDIIRQYLQSIHVDHISYDTFPKHDYAVQQNLPTLPFTYFPTGADFVDPMTAVPIDLDIRNEGAGVGFEMPSPSILKTEEPNLYDWLFISNG